MGSANMPDIPNIYVLLIGIDCYQPNVLPGGMYYSCLKGCVRDINNVKNFLTQRISVPDDHILMLTASNPDPRKPVNTNPAEPKERWPTYVNMVSAFKKITNMSRPGDIVYIHYSGHGGRIPTQLGRDIKQSEFDETLVPTDIENSRYLCDFELASILKSMTDKGLIVTIVLDSCHSGGATRGESRASVRGVSIVDDKIRPMKSMVGTNDEFSRVWTGLVGRRSRNIENTSGWIPEPKGYVLLAACRPSESAHEDCFEGDESNGALTYWLLNTLRQVGPGFTYRMVYDRLLAKIHSHFPDQTPMLEGEGDRILFGSGRMDTDYAVTVMEVDRENNYVYLNTGISQGIGVDAVFAILPSDLRETSRATDRYADRKCKIKIIETNAARSKAIILEPPAVEKIEEGDRAILVNPGSIRLMKKIGIVENYGREHLQESEDAKVSIEKLKKAIEKYSQGFVELSTMREGVDYQIWVNEKSEFEIWDSAGNTIKNLRPAVNINDNDASERIVRRLIHMSRYNAVRQLDNFDPHSGMSHMLTTDIFKAQKEYRQGEKPIPQPSEYINNPLTANQGEWVILKIKNMSPLVLNVVALDLQPDWGITQIYPNPTDCDFMPLDPGQEIMIPLQASLPAGYTEGSDCIKVMATKEPMSYRWLELPSLDKPLARDSMLKRAPGNDLERLMAAISADHADTRNVSPGSFNTGDWAVSQVELNIK